LSVELFIWLLIFAVSLAALLIGAVWFSAAASRFLNKAAAAGFAAIAVGAALPELALALAAVLSGRPELVLPIVLGSSVANIFLVVGASAAAAKNLPIVRECAEAEAPLLAGSAAILWFSAADGIVFFEEGLLMVVAFLVCVVFLAARGRINRFTPRDIVAPGFLAAGRGLVEIVGARFGRGFDGHAKNTARALLRGMAGAVLLALAAIFAVEALAGAATAMAISPVLLAFSVLAATAALPEIWGSLKIIAKKRYELVMGNVFSGTAVNVLLVTGVAAMFSPLPVGASAAAVGLPFFAAAVALLTVSGFSRKISSGQGWLYLFLYLLFWAKLFQIF